MVAVKLHYLFEELVPAFKAQSCLFAGKAVDLADFAPVLSSAQDYYLKCLDAKKIKHKPTSIVRHSDEYVSFLCFLAREAYRINEIELAEIAYLVNRRLNSFDCFYTRDLPDIFHLEHPIGSVLGPATFSNYLVIYQSVTVGGDINEVYPVFGEAVALFAKSSVIGKAVIGSNVAIGSHCQVFSEAVPSDTAIKFLRRPNGDNESACLTRVRLRRSIKSLFFIDQ